ncbi:hypothetical protein BS50DRAFT_567726 [Corynespora cassiicola Philippines]|uniref:Uncharacterized protein n=1 Tax=Corynespora cassiicola Philippines TaxID=1448308 RepID=A0A2T2PBG0_CORCC|nr:hypothetical protein BS50DRAFT_567726 [Corynespora cassiicola Philippines]
MSPGTIIARALVLAGLQRGNVLTHGARARPLPAPTTPDGSQGHECLSSPAPREPHPPSLFFSFLPPPPASPVVPSAPPNHIDLLCASNAGLTVCSGGLVTAASSVDSRQPLPRYHRRPCCFLHFCFNTPTAFFFPFALAFRSLLHPPPSNALRLPPTAHRLPPSLTHNYLPTLHPPTRAASSSLAACAGHDADSRPCLQFALLASVAAASQPTSLEHLTAVP